MPHSEATKQKISESLKRNAEERGAKISEALKMRNPEYKKEVEEKRKIKLAREKRNADFYKFLHHKNGFWWSSAPQALSAKPSEIITPKLTVESIDK